ncbi:hypothetical protein [Candidatus Aquicultor secundus]|uniref:hypothetical protein n=1 Tax=Candidatus Aquicultor secundus TaxID=1973895 RepID=UPI00257BA991|nr:hypothetical protein [Candidatus Aquicultor secundus]
MNYEIEIYVKALLDTANLLSGTVVGDYSDPGVCNGEVAFHCCSRTASKEQLVLGG